jgi:hypothetical protein
LEERGDLKMRYLLIGSLLAASVSVAAAAAVQDQPPQEEAPDIVVTGTRDVDGQLRDFVGALTQTTGARSAASNRRFVRPRSESRRRRRKRSFAASGESPRLRDRGRRPNCTPNVLLVVTGDKKEFIDGLWKRHAYYFGEMSIRDVRRLAQEPGPAAAWQVAGGLVNADGAAIPGSTDGPGVNKTTRSGSRLTSGARPQFAAAAVVVEMKALEGLTTTSLPTMPRCAPSRAPIPRNCRGRRRPFSRYSMRPWGPRCRSP